MISKVIMEIVDSFVLMISGILIAGILIKIISSGADIKSVLTVLICMLVFAGTLFSQISRRF